MMLLLKNLYSWIYKRNHHHYISVTRYLHDSHQIMIYVMFLLAKALDAEKNTEFSHLL